MAESMTGRSVLVFAAHPDDEILGCGGTLALHSQESDNVVVVIACEGESLRYGEQGVGQSNHTDRAMEILGIAEVVRLGFSDQRLDTITLTDLIEPLEDVVRRVRPSVVYTQWGGDINVDHRILFDAMLVATRPTETFIDSIRAFDTASSTEWAYPRSFVPDTFVDISRTLEKKIEAMSCYVSELRPYPHPRSLEALANRARFWGNQNCLDAAEAFVTIRNVIRRW
jgi:LmbE family N-acetylglucosaminyl deacetylase